MDIVKSINYKYWLDEFYEIVDLLDIKVDKTRFSGIKKLIKDLDKISYDDLWLISELQDFCEVYQQISKLNLEPLTIKSIVEGSPVISGEKNTTARDKFNEYKVKARFGKSGFNICEEYKGNDAKVEIDNKCFYIECKRVGSESKVESRVNKAYKQLGENKLNGIITIDVSKIVYKMFNNDANAFIQGSHKVKDVINDLFNSYLLQSHKDKLNEICAVVIHCRYPFYVAGSINIMNHFHAIYVESDEVKFLLKKLRIGTGKI